jgi:hypothetical protein
MRRFQKKPELTFAFIPGVGRLAAGQVLEGDQYVRFVPSLLVELPALPVAPVPSAPKVTPAVTPKVTPAVIIPPPPPMAPKTMAEAGFVSPEELVAAVDVENKETQVQIEQAVARLDPVKEEPKKEVPVPDLKKEVPKPKPSTGKKPSNRK